MSEEIIWKGKSSQILNIWRFLLTLLLAIAIGIGGAFFAPLWIALVIPLGWAFWIYLTIRCRVYQLTSERIRLFNGVLNQRIDEVELYRVKDTVLERPFWLRILGLSTIILDTSDRSHPLVRIEAVRDAVNLRDTLRKQVEFWRDRKRVREVDFEESGPADGSADGPADGDEELSAS